MTLELREGQNTLNATDRSIKEVQREPYTQDRYPGKALESKGLSRMTL